MFQIVQFRDTVLDSLRSQIAACGFILELFRAFFQDFLNVMLLTEEFLEFRDDFTLFTEKIALVSVKVYAMVYFLISCSM